MSRRKFIGTSVLLLALLGLCLYFNRDWFAGPDIQIYHRSSSRSSTFTRGRGAQVSPSNPVIFGFNRKLQLNSIKVVKAAEIETNKYAHPLWEMVSSSNSIPLRGFEYGQYIRGMHPKVANARPDPLEPGVVYLLLIEAGSLKGEHEFMPTPRTP
jgi:hypothetical protein